MIDTTDALQAQIDYLRDQGVCTAWDVYHYRLVAALIARQLRERNTATVDLEPGDGTSYKLVLTLHTPDEAGALGGRLTVAAPQLGRRGFAATIGLPAYIVLSYAVEKFSENIVTATTVGVFVSCLSDALDDN